MKIQQHQSLFFDENRNGKGTNNWDPDCISPILIFWSIRTHFSGLCHPKKLRGHVILLPSP